MKKQYETPWLEVEDIVTEKSILMPASFGIEDETVGEHYSNQRDEKTWGNLW